MERSLGMDLFFPSRRGGWWQTSNEVPGTWPARRRARRAGVDATRGLGLELPGRDSAQTNHGTLDQVQQASGLVLVRADLSEPNRRPDSAVLPRLCAACVCRAACMRLSCLPRVQPPRAPHLQSVLWMLSSSLRPPNTTYVLGCGARQPNRPPPPPPLSRAKGGCRKHVTKQETLFFLVATAATRRRQRGRRASPPPASADGTCTAHHSAAGPGWVPGQISLR